MPQEATTFIPRKSTEVRRRHVSKNMLSILASTLFVLSILAAIGVFAYEKITEGSIERKKISLEKARAAFEPALIEELARLDKRLVFSEELLNDHKAQSILFNLLEELTVSNVRFRTFSFTQGEEGIELRMEGEARSFNAIAVQADTFASSKVIKNGIFTNLNLDDKGNVNFTFSGTIDPAGISYIPQEGSGFEIGNDLDITDASTTPTTTPQSSTSTATSS